MTRRKPLPEPELTAEQLALAWREMRRPPTWPSTMEAVLQHPVHSKLLRCYARSLVRSRPPFKPAHTKAPHRLPTAPVPATPTQPQRFDPKRLAANDRDD